VNATTTCTNLEGLLRMEKAAIRCHMDAHLIAAQPADPQLAARTFIEGYGGLMRELFCAHVCPDRAHCGIAQAGRRRAG
jgi:hypothetical protein